MNTETQRVRVRAAPSPTGPPHVGTAYIALFDFVFAAHESGDFVLRIEDTDRRRSTLQSERAIIDSLRWLGLHWDEGPDVGGEHGPYRQSERSENYRQHAFQLVDEGAAYRCFCTPERLTRVRESHSHEEDFIGYDGHCRDLCEDEVQEKLAEGAPFTVRLRTPQSGETAFEDLVRGRIAVPNKQVDDQVLLKSDGFPTYHLANVVDDHLMQISHVVRAEEWISSTPKHILLYEAFGWSPPFFVHMPLLRNKDQSKISKRKNPTSLLWYREQGFLPQALVNFLGLMGWSMGQDREIFSLEEMIQNFTWDRVKTSGPVFDMQKLEWMNGEYIRAMSPENLLSTILQEPYTVRVSEPVERMLEITKLVQERLKRLSEFDDQTSFFFEWEDYDAQELIPRKKDAAFARKAIDTMRATLEAIEQWDAPTLEEALQGLCDEIGQKRGALYMPLRIAVTCRRVSTPLFETMEILGKEECMRRLDKAAEMAKGLR